MDAGFRWNDGQLPYFVRSRKSENPAALPPFIEMLLIVIFIKHAYPVSSGVLLRISMSPHNGMRNGGIMEYWDLKTELFRQMQYSNIPVFHYSDWGRALKLFWPQYLSEPDRHIIKINFL